MPFGAGPRVCIGSHFALAEAMLILAVILQHVELELPTRAGWGARAQNREQPELDLMPSVTLRPRGPVLMRMTPRARSTRVAAE